MIPVVSFPEKQFEDLNDGKEFSKSHKPARDNREPTQQGEDEGSEQENSFAFVLSQHENEDWCSEEKLKVEAEIPSVKQTLQNISNNCQIKMNYFKLAI